MPYCNIYVINIIESHDRRENICSQLNALGVEYEVIPAIDGKKEFHPIFDRYNQQKRLRLKGKPLVNGQLGCYASHYLLWEKCVVEQKPMIILEDDARLFKESFMRFYNNVDQLNARFECVRLFESYGKKRKAIVVETLEGVQIYKYAKGYMGTIGYYLSPAGAEKFIESSTEWFLTVDLFMDRFWSNKVEYYGVVPACLDFDPKFVSDIDYIQKKGKRSIMTKVQRELFSVSEAIRRVVWNLRFKAKHFWCLLITRKGKDIG